MRVSYPFVIIWFSFRHKHRISPFSQIKQSDTSSYLIKLIFINVITDRDFAAVVFAFQCIFCQTAYNRFGKFCRIIFCHAFQHEFQQNPLCTFGNGLACQHHANTVLAQNTLIVRRIVTITGKSVELPYNHNVEPPISCNMLVNTCKQSINML